MKNSIACLVVSAAFAACAPARPPTAAARPEPLTPTAPGQCRTPGADVEVVNNGSDRIEIFWISRALNGVEFRIGEAGPGRSVLPVPEPARDHIFSNEFAWLVRSVTPGRAGVGQHLNYTLRLRCTGAIR